MAEQKKSHFGAALLAGAIIGVATGLFLKSSKGKQMTKLAQTKARKMQTKLMKELENAKELSKDTYENLVNKLVAYYVTSKEITKAEVPAVRDFLMNSWTDIKKQLKNVK